MAKQKILIVDDERDSTFALEKTLSMKGYSVLTAETGQTAIQIAQSEKPDLILLDVMLPDIHGGDVAKVLQANADTKDIPIIFMSCLFSKDEEEKLMHKAGRFMMFAKPYDFDELLVAIESMLPAQTVQPQQDSTSIRQKVLIIDDDKDFANALMLFLRSNHFDVKTSFDGINGLQEAIEQQPDIILLDLKLPAGDGFTVIHRCSVNTKIAHIPIIVITGNSDSGMREEVLNYGATAFFEKPVDFDVLLKNIRLILAGRKVPAGEKK